jgi:hypothetical protein
VEWQECATVYETECKDTHKTEYETQCATHNEKEA